MKQILFYFWILLFLSSCLASSDMPSIPLKVNKSIVKLSDSIYLSGQVNCIDNSEGVTYISDLYGGLYVLNEKMELKNKIAAVGHGHNELIFPEFLYVDRANHVVIYDSGKKQFVTFFNDDGLKSKVTIANEVRKSNFSRFFALGDKVYSPITHDKYLVAVSKGDSVIKKICLLDGEFDNVRRPIDSQRHLLYSGNSMILVGRCLLPYLQKYTLDGKLLSTYDLRQIDILKHIYRNQNETVTNKTFVVVRDAYCHGDYVYLLVSSSVKPYRCNTLLVMHQSRDSFEYVCSYTLKGDSYRTFCITNDSRCMAVNAKKSTIEIYDLPKINDLGNE